jgi:hypothetical protein
VLLSGASEQCGENCAKVLLVGGRGAEGVEQTAELIDPTAAAGTRASAPTPEMVKPRAYGHSATVLPTGHVLVAGGGSDGSDQADYFHPKGGARGAWTAGAPSLRARRSGHTATLLPSGRLLMAGRVGGPATTSGATNAAELYDPYVGGRSVFAGQGPWRPQAAALLPSGPLSLCATSCGKVALSDAYSSFEARGWLYTPRPELAALAPAGGPASGGTKVTLEGRGLASVTSVRFGALEATGLTPDPQSPDTKLVAVAPPQRAGTVPVTATSSGGSSANTQSTQFTYTGAAGGGSGGGATNPAATAPASGGPQSGDTPAPDAGAAQAGRARALRSCLASATRHSRRERRRLRRGSARQRAKAKRHMRRHRNSLRGRCLARHGRTPGRIAGLSARAVSNNKVELSFLAPGTDRSRSPAAHSYLVKQSRRPIRGARGFRRAQTLCRGSCRFDITRVGARLRLTITDLRPGSSYYYAIAARDNVSRRLGPRSGAVRVSTR